MYSIRNSGLKTLTAAVIAGTLTALSTITANAAEPERPNIVFLLVDDMGWKDLGMHCEYFDTPNIDKLANQGIQFSQAYSAAPMCSATRAAILTGWFPGRQQLTSTCPPAKNRPKMNPTENYRTTDAPWRPLVTPPRLAWMPLERITFAERLKTAGYNTAFFGKWHLGGEQYYPDKQGFDRSIACETGWPVDWVDPYKRWKAIQPQLPSKTKGQYLTDRLTDEGLDCIEANKANPFFLYMSFYTVHGPYQARSKAMEKQFEAGHPEYNKYVKPGDTSVKRSDKTYAAMVKCLDENVGRIVDKLEQLGLRNNTIIVFTSDNGGIVGVDTKRKTFVTSNKPLRGEKLFIYEGGIRVPMIVSWPGHYPQGKVCDVPVVSHDLYPTFLSMAHVALPDPQEHPVDGESIMPLLRNPDSRLKRDSLYWQFPHWANNTPCAVIRQGDWKLISYTDMAYELYELKNDPGEKNNLASQYLERVTSMSKELNEYLVDTDTWMVKASNSRFDPEAENRDFALPSSAWIPPESKFSKLNVPRRVIR